MIGATPLGSPPAESYVIYSADAPHCTAYGTRHLLGCWYEQEVVRVLRVDAPAALAARLQGSRAVAPPLRCVPAWERWAVAAEWAAMPPTAPKVN